MFPPRARAYGNNTGTPSPLSPQHTRGGPVSTYVTTPAERLIEAREHLSKTFELLDGAGPELSGLKRTRRR